MTQRLKLGTRGSALARTQSLWVAEQVTASTGTEVDLVLIQTKGDRITDRPLHMVGGKGLFTKEVEEALLDGRVDFAVHSLKDMPTDMPQGLILGCVPEREDPRDVLVGCRVEELCPGMVIGTGSARRRAMLKDLVPDLDIRGIRGNVDTRVQKQRDGEYNAVVLAAAGLKRLGRAQDIDGTFSVEQMVPAVGQGALAVQCRGDDLNMRDMLMEIHCAATAKCVAAERAFLAALGGGCSVPAACHAVQEGENLRLLAAFEQNSGVVLRRSVLAKAGEELSIATEMAYEMSRNTP